MSVVAPDKPRAAVAPARRPGEGRDPVSFPCYPEHKDSGVAWLGQVPAHWMLPKIKHIATFCGGGTPSRETAAYWNGDIPWVSPKDMKSERIIGAEESITAEGLENSSSSLVAAGAVLLVVRSGILKHTIPVAINDVPVALNQDMKAIRFAADSCLSDFFLRWVQGLNDALLLAWAKQGATVESIEHDYFAEAILPLPPAHEQAAIAVFLDRETAKIDALIAEQEKLIALLKEKRQALISHAVTKGLDPDAPMKDSGIEWLGDVPAHWDTTTIRRVALRVDTGGTPIEVAPSDQIEDPTPWFTPGDFTGPLNLAGSARAIPRSIVKDGEAKCFPAGSTLIVSIGATLGKVGYAASECSANQQINAIIPTNRLDGYFLTYSLTIQTDQMRFLSSASTIGIINQEKTKGIMIAVPPREEQAEICRFLDDELKRHESLECAIARAIALLKERRAALISAAVTGKIDVRAQALQNEQLSP